MNNNNIDQNMLNRLEEISRQFEEHKIQASNEIERLNNFIRENVQIKYKKGNCIFITKYSNQREEKEVYRIQISRDLQNYVDKKDINDILLYHKYIEDFDINIIEDVLHKVLIKYKYRKTKEWFKVNDIKILIQEIDIVYDFLKSRQEYHSNIQN